MTYAIILRNYRRIAAFSLTVLALGLLTFLAVLSTLGAHLTSTQAIFLTILSAIFQFTSNYLFSSNNKPSLDTKNLLAKLLIQVSSRIHQARLRTEEAHNNCRELNKIANSVPPHNKTELKLAINDFVDASEIGSISVTMSLVEEQIVDLHQSLYDVLDMPKIGDDDFDAKPR